MGVEVNSKERRDEKRIFEETRKSLELAEAQVDRLEAQVMADARLPLPAKLLLASPASSRKPQLLHAMAGGPPGAAWVLHRMRYQVGRLKRDADSARQAKETAQRSAEVSGTVQGRLGSLSGTEQAGLDQLCQARSAGHAQHLGAQGTATSPACCPEPRLPVARRRRTVPGRWSSASLC